MHPVLSIGIYLLGQLLTLAVAWWSLYPSRERTGRHLKRMRNATLILYIILSMFPVAGALLPDSPVKFFLQAAGNIWLGFALYAEGMFLLLLFFRQIIRFLLHDKKPGIVRPAGVLNFSVFAACVFLIYGMVHAQNTIVTRYEVTVPKSAGTLTDLNVVLIADLHLSVNTYYPTVENIVHLVNEEQPDVVLIAGDIFTSSYTGLKDPDRYAALLSTISAPYGVFAVYGNHDVEETLFGGFPISPVSEAFRTGEMEQFFKDCHFTVLYDETVRIADDQVQIVGRIDGGKAGDGTANRKSPAQVLSDVDQEKCVIVLEHEPMEFAGLKENGADLTLCGHTHAGQFFPGNLIVPFFNENAYGYRKVGGLDTIVTSGTGYYGPPMRIGTNSEITVIHLHFEAE